MRIARDREATLRLMIDDEDGELVDADVTPTISVVDGDGESIEVGAVEKEREGVYRAVLQPQESLDVLTATWTAEVGGYERRERQTIYVVAERLVPFWRLRQDPEMSQLTGAQLAPLVEAVEDWFRSALRFPPVEEPLRTVIEHPGGRCRVPGAPYIKSIQSLTRGEWEYEADVVFGALEADAGTYDAWLTHGSPWWETPPEDIVRAAVTLARYINRGSNYPERARMVQTDGAIINLATPDARHPTGLPDVDAVIERYRLEYVV